MKQLKSICIFVLLISSLSFTQTKIGVIGGLNFADLKTTFGMEYRTLFGSGLYLNYSLNDNLSIGGEILYQKFGAFDKADDISNPDITIDGSKIEIPVLLKYEFGTKIKPFILWGAGLGFILANDIELEIPGVKVEGSMKDVTQKFDFGVYIGGGLSYTLSEFEFFIEGKYRFGLNNLQKGGRIEIIHDDSSVDLDFEVKEHQFYTRGFELMAGIAIPI